MSKDDPTSTLPISSVTKKAARPPAHPELVEGSEDTSGQTKKAKNMSAEFSGRICIFHAIDIGDDVDLELIKQKNLLKRRPATPAPYFKNYHRPLTAELPEPHMTPYCDIVRIHHFGAISLQYKIPFTSTLEQLRGNIERIDNEYQEKAIADAATVYKQIESAVKQPLFFHLNKSYILIQVDTKNDITGKQIQEMFGGTIASLLRFEVETLSEYKKNEILESAFGYYRGDLIVIDTEAAFLYDDEYEEVLELFEFVNVQHLELQYFDRVLDKQLTQAYSQGRRDQAWYHSFMNWRGGAVNPLEHLDMLKVEISVITERMENSIKLVGEPYYSELYTALSEALDLNNWKESINKKLNIIHDLTDVYENRAQTMRDNTFSILIIILIFLELIVGIGQLFR